MLNIVVGSSPTQWVLLGLCVDTRGTNFLLNVKLTACKREPDDWWIFDDSSPAPGKFDSPSTTLEAARSDSDGDGGQNSQPDLSQGENNVFFVNKIL
eukprot:6179688-Pleurochrysis_carterae.AAC.1